MTMSAFSADVLVILASEVREVYSFMNHIFMMFIL
jgi:hypothetical protein